jgi:CelD/BcsL family acetyltransferase involved in cellulose biosynthesis
MSEGELITDIAELEALAPEWDALAVAASNPVAAPAWILAWWHHVATPDLQLRVVAVRDRGTLVGLAPFYAAPARRGVVEYRLMASDFGMCMEPLALAGREWEVAGAVARALSASHPRPDVLAFGPMTVASHWTTAVRSLWPGAMLGVSRQHRVEDAPVIVLRESSFESWFASLSSKLRHDLRRSERLFEEAGGSTRWSTAETLRADAEAFSRLHASRWESRGGSRLSDLGSRLPDWLEELGRGLIDDGRFGMCVLEVDGAPVCVDFGLIAGEELATVNTGWDERYAKLSPAKLALLRVVRQAYEQRCRRIHLGIVGYENKVRFANGNDPTAWTMFMPPSPRLARTYGGALPGLLRKRARGAAERALPPDWFETLRKLKG